MAVRKRTLAAAPPTASGFAGSTGGSLAYNDAELGGFLARR